MIDFLAYGSAPVFLLVFVALANLLLVALGSAIGRRFEAGQNARADAAFGVAQAAIFGVTTLILAFSFSFASSRFDARRTLVVDEANDIGTTYLRAAYLPPSDTAKFRSLLYSYARARLNVYRFDQDSSARERIERGSIGLQDDLWSIASNAGRADFHNVQLSLLTQTLNDTIDDSAKQDAALTNHLPDAIIGLILIVTFAAALMMGVTFGRANSPNRSMALAFSILFAIVVMSIVDLDRPQRGLVHVDLAPLQRQIDSMKP